MVQSINKNHNKNEITSFTDNSFYVYLSDTWKKSPRFNYVPDKTFETHEDMNQYDKTLLSNNDVLKVNEDSAHEDNEGYYKYHSDTQTFEYLGQYQPSYLATYYKYYDEKVEDIDPNNFNVNDCIITYKSVTNYIKFSESFGPDECKINDFSQWNITKLNYFTNDPYKFPNTCKNTTKFQSDNSNRDSVTEHSISQIFNTKPNELYIASCMIKQVTTSTNYVAFQLFDDTYNVGISVKYDLSDNEDYDAENYKDVTNDITFVNSNFETVTSTTDPAINHIKNISAGIYKLEDSTGNYFRLVIKCSVDFDSIMRIKLLLLNNAGNYMYTSKQGEPKYIIYANAFQLEKHDDLTISKPSNYIVATDKLSLLKVFDKIYRVTINSSTSKKQLSRVYKKLYYIYDIKEYSRVIPGVGVETYLESFTPTIAEPSEWDIAVVPSMISFYQDNKLPIYRTVNTYAAISKSYENNNNEKPKEGQVIRVKADEKHGGKESLYRYKNNMWKYIIYDDSIVNFGKEFHIENPEYTINYDLIKSQYVIKVGNSYKILSYISEEKNRQAMVKAMVFNQGNFETWCKQDRGDRPLSGFNTGGGFNYNRMKRFFPKY